MSSWPKTIGFAATLPSATWLIYSWCQVVRWHFQAEHPGSQGGYLCKFYWDFSWIGIVTAVALSLMLVVLHVRKRGTLYEVTYYFSIWLLVVWSGIALIAMELPFVPWFDLHGAHY